MQYGEFAARKKEIFLEYVVRIQALEEMIDYKKSRDLRFKEDIAPNFLINIEYSADVYKTAVGISNEYDAEENNFTFDDLRLLDLKSIDNNIKTIVEAIKGYDEKLARAEAEAENLKQLRKSARSKLNAAEIKALSL